MATSSGVHLVQPQEHFVRTPFEGKFFFGGYGPASVPTMQFFNFLVTNPGGSGVNLVIRDVLLFSELKTEFAEFRVNPTGGLPTTNRTIVNAKIGGPASLATLDVDVSAAPITGGALSDFRVTIPPNDRELIELPPLIAPPGISLSLSVPNTSGGAANILVILRWAEMPV